MQIADPVIMKFTPNPNTLRYEVSGKAVLPRGTVNFTEPRDLDRAPLARRLFEVPGVTAVMLGPNFVTVTMDPQAEAGALHDGVHMAIHGYIDAKEEPAVQPELLEEEQASSDDTPAVQRIKQIIEEEVRPAVAMDGGDISFERFHDGTVYVFMKGSCSSCPSSTATLKMGIETRLREEVPEVVQVVQV